MLGPLKFGLQKPLAAVTGFELKLTVEGGKISFLVFEGGAGQTGSIDLGNGTITTINFLGVNSYQNLFTGSNVTIRGPNSIQKLTIIQLNNFFGGGANPSITGITGTYPTGLQQFGIDFNKVNPTVFKVPNIPKLFINGNSGPSSLTTGTNLTNLSIPRSITSLDLSASSKLTDFTFIGGSPFLTGANLILPTAATSINVNGNTFLTSLTIPPKVLLLDITNCSGITGVKLPSTLTTLRIEGSGLQSLDLSGTNVTTLNIPPNMDSQLKTVNLARSKLKLSGLVNYEYPEDNIWTLY